MRLTSFRRGDRERFGIATSSGVIDLGSRLSGVSNLRDLIAQDRLADARAALSDAGGEAAFDHRFEAVEFLPPITDPEKIWCVGVNYADRNAEYKDGSEQARYPSLFARNIRSFVGHGVAIERPSVSEQLDYEGEIVLVVGRGGRHLSPDTALECLFGVTLCNEGTVRDWLRHGKFNVTQGKNFDRSGSLGPWIVTADAVDLVSPLSLTTRVNGEVRQQDTTERLIFPFRHLLAYLSTFATLAPGDLIVTGTPTGAGARCDPPVWLKAGDIVEVESPQIGRLRNVVVDER